MANFQTDTFTEDEVVQLITDNTSGFTKQDALDLFDKSSEVNTKIANVSTKEEALAYDFIGGI